MDTHECQPLYLAIREFYEGLNMKVDQQIPLLLVERQALNEAMEGEKNVRTNVVLSGSMLSQRLDFISLSVYLTFSFWPSETVTPKGSSSHA